MGLSGEITVNANLVDQAKIIDYLAKPFEEAKLPEKQRVQVSIAIDEIFGNICMHGYKDKIGKVTFQYKICTEKDSSQNGKNVFWFSFIDKATEFNPLESETPDLSSDILKRDIGGLGLFIVGKIMDEIEYQYIDGKNKLNIKKYFDPDKHA